MKNSKLLAAFMAMNIAITACFPGYGISARAAEDASGMDTTQSAVVEEANAEEEVVSNEAAAAAETLEASVEGETAEIAEPSAAKTESPEEAGEEDQLQAAPVPEEPTAEENDEVTEGETEATAVSAEEDAAEALEHETTPEVTSHAEVTSHEEGATTPESKPTPENEDEIITAVEETSESDTYISNNEVSSDELFAAYVDREFGIPSTNAPKLYARRASAGSRLKAATKGVYDYISSQLPLIAAGERTYTVFEIPVEDLGIPLTYTKEDLGVSAIIYTDTDGTRRISQEAKDALAEKVGFNLDLLLDALLADHPYLLYWFDKTQNVKSTGYVMSGLSTSITIKGQYTVYFQVAQEYASTELGEFNVNPEIGQTVQDAVANAHDIADRYDSYTDVDKLKAFRQEICGLTSYNSAAAAGGVEYGNPWQLIWVFDSDATTNVVCEGYAKAFKYLCDLTSFQNSVSCSIVTGKMGTIGHMWNLVSMENDKNYLADVTNCDTGMVGSPAKLFLVGASGTPQDGYTVSIGSRSIVYTYDEEMFDVWSEEELTLSSSNYHVCSEYLGEQETVYDPTCYEPGMWRRVCSFCGDEVTGEIPMIDHTWDEEYTVDELPTCSTEGIESIHCSVCGAADEATARPIDKTAHTYGDWHTEKEQTCTEAGSRKMVCEVCGDEIFEEIPAAGHKWDEAYTVDVSPTYEMAGSKSIHCSVCGEIKEGSSVAIPKLLKPLSLVTFSGISAKTYTGSALSQPLVLKDGTRTLVNGTDYTVQYANNTNAGTATITLTGEGAYTGTVTRTFTIQKAANKITAKNFAKTYSSKSRTFSLGVKIANGTPTYKSSTKSVTVSKAGKVTIKAKYIGKATITITAPERPNYSKTTKKITITVNPTKTALSSVSSPSKGKITVKWKKNSVGTGYVIQYSRSSKFTSPKYVWVTKNTTLARTISSLTAGKKYYVRIRTYKKIGTVKYY